MITVDIQLEEQETLIKMALTILLFLLKPLQVELMQEVCG